MNIHNDCNEHLEHHSDPLANVRDGIIGLFVGDAVGVPYEFMSRSEIARQPATDMIGYGTHRQPPGTWSDDSTMTMCLLYSLHMYPLLNTDDLGRRFIQWYRQAMWTAHDELFDIGIATRQAIERLEQPATVAEEAGGTDEYSNGNGSLMRILPLAYRLVEADMATRYQWIRRVSSLTHRHPVSILAGVIYIEFAIGLLKYGRTRTLAQHYTALCETIRQQYSEHVEMERFQRIWNGSLITLPQQSIQSSGYVLHTLEASLWTLLHTNSYREAVLQAVNLGEDTDTTGAVTGGLAGMYYGYETIPQTWRDRLVRREYVEELCQQFASSCAKVRDGGSR
ncbi:ADP-ribosylglycohydrolase family protein [Paenibacillus sp. SGZ-1009]|uniref:ADP-ribosylglycohydrolase family protein n=1 Tax=Paenibacillus campi TaxID=3106031 RepID=UPI002AFEF9A8|nr:ADP-ribosylglycohydrolase family protein [Paenibacillus sp. SGZ-1009]